MSRGRRRAWRSRHRVKLGGQWIYWLLVLLVAAILFTGAVILGNSLKRRAEAGGDVSGGEETTLPDFDPSGVPAVIARAAEFGEVSPALGYLAAANKDETIAAGTENTAAPESIDTTESETAETSVPAEPRAEYTNHSYNAYSVIMLGENGEPMYDSNVRRRLLGAEADVGGLPKLDDGMIRFGDAYVSGIMFLHHRDADDDMRGVVREYETALAAEVLAAGADDVVLFGMSLDADAAEFCAAVKAAAGRDDIAVGIAVEYDELVSDEARENLVIWGGSFDLIALDLRGATSAEEIETKLHSVRALIGIYRMRVIVDDVPGMAAAAIDGGAENVAEIPNNTDTETAI